MFLLTFPFRARDPNPPLEQAGMVAILVCFSCISPQKEFKGKINPHKKKCQDCPSLPNPNLEGNELGP